MSAVLFDLDGTLVDSEPAYWASDRAFLAGWGIEYGEELNASMVGRGSAEFLGDLERLFPASPLHALPLDERARRKDEAYLAYARTRVKPFPGVIAFARTLAARGLPLAVASGSTPLVIDRTLETTGLAELFPVRVSASEVPRGKPEPDVFLEAARRLGVEPALCLVVEDSRLGVAGARAAGMRCVSLPPPGAESDIRYTADLVVAGGAAAFDPDVVLTAFAFSAPTRPSPNARPPVPPRGA